MKKFVRMIGFFSIMLCLTSMVYAASPGDLKSGFSTARGIVNVSMPNVVSTAQAIAKQISGKFIVAGTHINSGHIKIDIKRYNTNGTIDTTFGTNGTQVLDIGGSGVDDHVTALAVDADDSLVIVGYNARGGFVARLLADGSALDVDGFGRYYNTSTIATYAAGELYFDGASLRQQSNDDEIDTPTSSYLSPTYSVDSGDYIGDYTRNGVTYFSIDTVSNVVPHGVSIDTNGKIVVVGDYDTLPFVFVYRFNTDGQADRSFNESDIDAGDGTGYRNVAFNGSHENHLMAVQTVGADGDIYAAGYYSDGTFKNIVIAKMLGFNDGDTLVAGMYDTNFNTTGFVTATPAGSAHHTINAMQIDGSGNIVVAGSFFNNVYLDAFVARYTSAGALDTTFNSTDGYMTFTVGSGDDVINELQIDGNGNIVVAGFYNVTLGSDAAFVARVLHSTGALDTSFGTSSSGIKKFSWSGTNKDSLTGLAIDASNSLAVCGYNRTSAYLAKLDSNGALDTANFGFITGSKVGLLGETIANKYEYKALFVDSSDKVFMATNVNGASTILSKINVDGTLDTSFGGSGTVAISEKTATAVVQDANGKVLICGQEDGSGFGWLRRYAADGNVDSSFGSSGLVTSSVLTAARGIILPTTDTIVVLLQNSLRAYNADGTAVSWDFTKNNFVIDDFVADSHGYIYIVARQVSGGSVLSIHKINARTGLQTTFGGSGSGITNLSSSTYDKACIALDGVGNVVVALHLTDNSGVDVKRYSTSAANATPDTTSSITAITTLSRLQGTAAPKMVLAGATATEYVVAQLQQSDLTLDTAFNGVGYQTFVLDDAETSRVFSDMNIDGSGNIVSIGYASINSDSDIQSWMTRILGDSNKDQVVRFTQVGPFARGAVDTTFAVEGLLDISAKASGNAKIIRVQSSGDYIVVTDDGTNSLVIKVSSTGVIDTTFNGTGVLQLTGKVAPADLVMFADDSFLITGGTSTSWVVKVNADGTLDSNFGTSGYVATNITKGLKLAQQANGRWILAGKSGSTGVLQAYSAYGVTDTTFATAGVYSTAVNSSIVDVAIDAKDRVVFGYVNGSGTLVISRLNSNGKSVDIGYTTAGSTDFQFGTAGVVTTDLTSIASDDDVRVVLGSTGAIYAVAYTDSKLKMRRYGQDGASEKTLDMIPEYPITLKSVRPLSDGSLLIIGYESATDSLALVRVNSALTVDTSLGESSFGAADGGLLEVAIGDIDQFNDVQVISSAGLMLATYDQDATKSYLIKLVDSVSSLSDVSQSVSVSSVGTVDQNFVYNSIHDGTKSALPLNNLITSAGHYYLATEKTTLSSYYDVAPSFAPELVYYDATNKYTWIAGTAYTTGGSAVETRIIRVNADGKKVNFASGTNGVVTLAATNPVAMLVAQDGYMYIAGSDWVSKVNITSGATSSFYNVSSASSDDYQPISNVTITGLAQQSNGRILLVGSSSNHPYIASYSSDGLYQDPTFIYSSVLSSVTGTAIGACVASDDSIFLGYVDSGTVKIAKFLPDGSGLATSFASSGIKTTDINSVNSSSDAKMLVDASGNMVVVAATNTKKYKAAAYDQSGTLLGSVYSSADVTTESHLLSASLVLTNSKDAHALQLRVAYVGYDNQGSTDNKMVVGQLGANDAFQNEISVLGSQTQRKATDVVCLPDGMLWFVGYEYVSTTYTPYVARVQSSVYAANTTTMQTKNARAIGYNDMTFDLTTLSGFTTSDTPVYMKMFASSVDSDFYHTYNNSYTKYGTYFVGFNGSSSSYIAKIIGDHKLDTAYSSDGLATSLPAGLLHFTYDYQGRTLLAGYNSTNKGWLYRLNSSQSADSGFGSSGLLTEVFGSATDATVNQVAMQSMGRIIVAGTDGTQGYLRAIDEQGLVDTVWATQGNYAPKDVSTIPAVAVASNDTVYCAYEEKDGSCTIAKFREEGTLDTSFSLDGLADHIFNSTAIVASTLKIAVDPNRAVIFAASVSSGSQRYAAVGKYTSSGNISWRTLNLDFGTTGVTVADLCLLENGKFVVVGYTSTDTYILYCNSNGSLANTIALTGLTASSAAGVNYDGRLVIVGQDSGGKPTIARVQLDQYNQQADAGDVLNPARIGSVDPIFSTNETYGVSFFGVSGASASSLHKARAIAFDSNNDIYVAVDKADASDFYLVKFKQDGTLDTSFSGDGMATISSVYDDIFVTDMTVYTDVDDSQKKALIAGYTFSNVLNVYQSILVQYILTTASVDTTFGNRYLDPVGFAFADLKIARSVKTTGQGNIILAGENQSGAGTLAAYNRSGLLNTSWGTNAGLYTLSNTTGLYTHLIDNNNKIVAAYKNGSNVDVVRVLANGSGLDTSFGTSGVISGAISGVAANDQIRVARDASNNIYVVARTSNSVIVKRYDSTGANPTSRTISYSSNLGGITSFTMASIAITEDGKVLVVGTDNNNDILIFRVLANLSGLDTTFNTTGYQKYNVGVTGTTAVSSMLVHPDGRIIIIGYES